MTDGRRNLLSYLDELPAHGSRTLYLWRDGVRWRRRSYAEVHGRALACAEQLAGAGIGPGHAVLLQGPEAADWVEALHAVIRLGAVAVPLSPDTPDEFRRKVADKAGARLLIAPKSVSPPPGVTRVELGSWPDRPEHEPSRADPVLSDRAEVMFTSGTTGDPKGVVLTHGNLISDLAPIERGFRRRERYIRLAGTVPILSTVPLSHMFGQVLAGFLLPSMGLTLVFTPPRPLEVIEASRRHGAYGMVTVPRVLELLAAELRREIRRDGSLEAFERRHQRLQGRSFVRQSLAFRRVQRHMGWRFRFMVVGGAALQAGLLQFFEGLGYLVTQGYGLTETAPVVTLSNPFRRGSTAVGRPLRGQEVRIGPDGQIWVRGGNVSPGYLGEQASGSPDGWFATGDVGEIDAQGSLHIKGRAKDVIVTPEGENVHAGDVEQVLEAIPGVRGACVVGLPDGGGDHVHAVLLLAEGVEGNDVVRAANQKLEARQRIRAHTIWPDDDLPRTSTGKVRKGAVVEALKAMSAGAPPREALEGLGGDLRSLVARVARVDPGRIKDDTRLQDDLGLGSLDLVELVVAAEDELGIALPEEGLEAATFGDLRKLARDSHDAGRNVTEAARVEVVENEDEMEETAAPQAGRRGRLRMPRWASSTPVRVLRRAIEETTLFPLMALYIRTRVEGREHLEGLTPPFLVIANHRSHLDMELVKRFLPARLRGRVAPAMTTRHHRCAFGEVPGPPGRYLKERLQVFLLQLLFNAWPLPETAGFRHSLSYAGELADRGFIPLIFPEGRHVPEGEMHPFRGGIGLFVRELRCPVLPVYVEGTADVLPAAARWLRFGRARLVFGRPFEVDPNIPGDEAARLAEKAVRSLAPESLHQP
ncbi:MAG: AMP-binding protein [Candidatus Polarisedimenticolia bacterium]